MNENMTLTYRKLLERTKEALEKNNMNAIVAESKEEARALCEKLIKKGATVSNGGSVTLSECGIIELLKSGEYDYIDREQYVDKNEAYRKCFSADFYLSSSNAITENGALYNVDGNGNRVACICYGPENVIIVAGRNKIVKDVDEAVYRVKTLSAPANCNRLNCNTYCYKTGRCMGADGEFTDGCKSDNRICASYVITGFQRIKGRITVILVNEDFGY